LLVMVRVRRGIICDHNWFASASVYLHIQIDLMSIITAMLHHLLTFCADLGGHLSSSFFWSLWIWLTCRRVHPQKK
jgi:hypothetical protein